VYESSRSTALVTPYLLRHIVSRPVRVAGLRVGLRLIQTSRQTQLRSPK